MGGGSKTTSTSTQQSSSGSGQTWANPYAVSGVNEIMSVYQANKPNLDAQTQKANQLADQFSGNLAGTTDRLNQATADYGAAQGLGGAATGYYNDVLGGKYLSGNPYLDAMIKATNSGVTDQVNSQFTQAGRYGSGAQTGVLTKELANAQNTLRYNNYSDEMNRMASAASGLSQDSLARLGIASDRENAIAGQQAAAGGLALGAQQQAIQTPYTGTNELAQALAALFGGGTSTGTSNSVSKTSNGIGGLIGPALSGAAMLSDPRAKYDAVLIDREPDGLGLYEYAYLGSDEREYGVMADEVAELRPWALGPMVDGFRTINYEAL